MSEEITQKNTKLALVPAKYYEIFALRMLGLTYEQIAEKTKYTADHIRHLFARGGVLHDFWRNWVEDFKKENVDEAMDMMFGHLPDIVRANILHAKSQALGAVLARKMLFEYTLGKPEDRLKINAAVGIFTFADYVKQQTLAQKENDKSTAGSETIPKQPD